MPLPEGVSAIFPFAPDWASPVRETRAYRTDVLTSRDRTEQRRALRAKPRGGLEYRIAVHHNGAAHLDRFLWSLQPHPLLVPLWSWPCRLTVEASGDVLSLDRPLRGDARVGDALVLYESATRVEAGTIVDLSTDRKTLTLETALAESWAAGSTVLPAWECVITSELRGRRRTNQLIELPITFDRRVDGRPAGTPPGVPDMLFDGVEVLLREVNWAGGIESRYGWVPELIDPSVGPFATEIPGRFAPHVITADVLCRNRAAVDWWLGFFDRMKGRRGVFLTPTRSDPLPLVAPTGAADFEVDNDEFGRYAPPPETLTHLLVLKQDGSRALYAIDEVTPDFGDGVTRITTVDPWDEVYGPHQALGTQLVMTARLATDTLELEWPADGVAEFTLAITATERLP